MSQNTIHRTDRLLSVTGLLLVYVFTRLHNLMALPLFVDESIYIQRAQLVREGHILRPAPHGRILHAWYEAFLGPYPPGGEWLARVAIVTLGLLGAAAFYGLVRSFVSHRAGLVALVIWITTPYLLFYDRMALADPALSTISVIAVWIAWQMARTGWRWLAVLLGFALFSVMLAKASGTAWIPLPLVALILVGGLSWRARVTLGALAYGTFGALWGAFTLVLRWRGYNYFGVAERFVRSNESIFERTRHNFTDVWGFDVAYLGWPVLILAIGGGLYWLWQRPRPALFGIMALGMGGGGAIVFGRSVNSRYALNHVAWVVLLFAVGVGLLIERYPRRQQVIYLVLAGWIAGFFGPFAYDAWTDPAGLPLIENDPREYITGESSGFGVTEIGSQLSTITEPLPTLGLVANCQALRLAAYPLEVTCPRINWESTNPRRNMRQVEQWAADGPIYVVGENLPYIDLNGLPEPHSLIATVERPGDGVPVHLFRIEQGAQQPD